MRKTTALFLAITASCVALAQEQGVRTETSLNADWQTAFADSIGTHTGFERTRYSTQTWQTVNVPHSWESYEGYRRLKHGNLHGYAWYRKTFTVGKRESGRRYFIFFEGVGSYATVWVNGQELGKHAGGRTTFTVDVTNALSFGGDNLLAVRADHPAEIRDLPWVCGGCSSAWGFSEGSQPIGIFRPVTLIATGDVRVEPFGLHVWNDEHISDKLASLHANVELKNYSSRTRSIAAVARLFSPDDSLVASLRQPLSLAANSVDTLSFLFDSIAHPQLWSPDAPQLYSVVVDLVADGDLTDHTSVSCGIRTLSWPAGRKGSDGRFFINGKPFFVNGVCEYEHNMGASHAFTEEQIYARVSQMRAAGFNAFREAHQPHNLRYGSYMDILGMPWWTQMSAQIWFDTPEFRSNFKALLREWVRERRNHPAVVLWGLQNESKLPEDFAKECVDIIRELDPTTSSQRKVTTCNGGVGTDWNVVQNWSGTYGGNPQAYARELSKQLLNGEYGAWRSMDLRTEGSFDQNGELSEDRFLQLMELKAQQAEAAKTYSCGHFQWLLSSHENPGRTQNGEGLRELDRIGPVNYKGLLTAWGEPTDAYFMYRARYTPQAEPMVYIPMHTWPDRWTTTGVKDSVVVYSNCDELELWCDTVMLGMQRRRKNQARFVFRHVNVNSEVLFALGMLNNSPTVVASDAVLLHHLPRSSYAEHIVATNGVANTTESIEGYTYLYRLNCGGPDYTDINGSTWHADVRKSLPETCGSRSWTDNFPGLPPFYGSQRRTHDLIFGTYDHALYQTFRYGQNQLSFEFPVPNGSYIIELHFVEPWYGRGGISRLVCNGWRMFDVAINGNVLINDLDIHRQAGYNRAYKVSVEANAINGLLVVSFPQVKAGQAIISAIAIATKRSNIAEGRYSPRLIHQLRVSSPTQQWEATAWMDAGDRQYLNSRVQLSDLPPRLYGAAWLRTPKNIDCQNCASFVLSDSAEVYVGLAERYGAKPAWMADFTATQSCISNGAGETFTLYARRFAKGERVRLGGNVAPNAPTYIVAATYATSLNEAADLRPTQRHEVESAADVAAACIATVGSSTTVALSRPECSALNIALTVGVADVYALRIRYRNANADTVPLRLHLEDASHVALHSETLHLAPTSSDKPKTHTTTTGTPINAGAYILRLHCDGEARVEVDWVELQ